jgi:hypothetical protein
MTPSSEDRFQKTDNCAFMVHVNHLNITSGTESFTLPVNFDQPVHPIKLQKYIPLEKTLRSRVSLF